MPEKKCACVCVGRYVPRSVMISMQNRELQTECFFSVCERKTSIEDIVPLKTEATCGGHFRAGRHANGSCTHGQGGISTGNVVEIKSIL